MSKEIRQALAAVVDREAIASQAVGKMVLPAYHVVPSGYPYAGEPFLQEYGLRNMVFARQRLRDAGYTENNPLELELWYPLDYGNSFLDETLALVKGQIEETGLAVLILNGLPRFEYIEKAEAGELPFFIREWHPVIVDPLPSLQAFAACGGSLFCNDELERLFLAAGSADSIETYQSVIQQIDSLYASEVPAIPLFWEQGLIAYYNGLDGILVGAADVLNYKEIQFNDQANPASGNTDTLILGTAEEVTSLDTASIPTRHDREILNNIGLPLLAYKPGTSVLEYGTVLTFPSVSDNNLSYSYFLREDLRFADGSPLRAGMYLDHWWRLASLEGHKPGEYLQLIDEIEIVNDLSLVIHLKRPAAMIPALSAGASMIVSNPAQFPADEINEFPDQIDGLGPYRMVSHRPGYEMVLAANPHYVLGNPAIPNVVIRYYDDPSLLCDALERGEIDIAWGGLGTRERDRLQAVEGIQLDMVPKPALYALAFHFQDSSGDEIYP